MSENWSDLTFTIKPYCSLTATSISDKVPVQHKIANISPFAEWVPATSLPIAALSLL